MRKRRVVPVLLLALAGAALRPARAEEEPAAPKPGVSGRPGAGEIPIGIRHAGFLPGSIDAKLAGRFRVEFRIYRSPQGGDPIWREERVVAVKGGRMDVLLGEKNPIPMAVHEATFKFLGASVEGNREVYPRHPIVNVVYASAKEALLGRAEPAAAAAGAEKAAGTGAPGARAGYEQGAVKVSPATEKPATWSEALRAARGKGGDLPDYEDWYRALEASSVDEIHGRTGHYEWVLPWVYDTASHGRLNAYFRGRFQGCDYMDLSPEREYPYRVAHARKREAPAPGGDPGASGAAGGARE